MRLPSPLPGITAALVCTLGLLALPQAWAQLEASATATAAAVASGSPSELQHLGARRAELEARFKAEALLCEQRFAVNDCLDRLRAERSLALKPIVAREQAIDQLERRARAEAQRQRVIEREQEAARIEAQRRTSELLAAQREALRMADPAVSEPPPVAKPRPSAQELEQAQRASKQRADQEAERRLAQRQAFERQQAAHQREAQLRLAQREAQSKGKKAPTSLPIPTAAEIAAASQAAASAAGKR